VLDVWDERNKLRVELAELRQQGVAAAPVADQPDAAQIRETCALELEAYADACAEEPDQPEYVAQILRVAASLVRTGPAAAEGEEVPVAEAVPPEAVEVDIPLGEAVFTGEAVAATDDIPTANSVTDEPRS